MLCEAILQVIAACLDLETTMMRGSVSNWTTWYVDDFKNKETCWICFDSFTKKSGRMLSYLRYILGIGQRNLIIKICKNMKLEMARAFRGCSSMPAPPPKPAELQQLQCNA
jgi:hypothetical protein